MCILNRLKLKHFIIEYIQWVTKQFYKEKFFNEHDCEGRHQFFSILILFLRNLPNRG